MSLLYYCNLADWLVWGECGQCLGSSAEIFAESWATRASTSIFPTHQSSPLVYSWTGAGDLGFLSCPAVLCSGLWCPIPVGAVKLKTQGINRLTWNPSKMKTAFCTANPFPGIPSIKKGWFPLMLPQKACGGTLLLQSPQKELSLLFQGDQSQKCPAFVSHLLFKHQEKYQ